MIVSKLASAQSVAVTFSGGGSAPVTINIDRDMSKIAGYTATYSAGSLSTAVNAMNAIFYGQPKEGGIQVGRASANVTFTGSSLNLANIDVVGTVQALSVVPASISPSGAAVQLNFEALDDNGRTVAVDAGAAFWSIQSGSSITVTQDGIATPKTVGATTVEVIVDNHAGTGIVDVTTNALIGTYPASYSYSNTTGTLTIIVGDDGTVSCTDYYDDNQFTYTGTGKLVFAGSNQASVSIPLASNGLPYATLNGTFALANGAKTFSGNLVVVSGPTVAVSTNGLGDPPSLQVTGGLIPTAVVDYTGGSTISYNGTSYIVVGDQVVGTKAVLIGAGQSLLKSTSPTATGSGLTGVLTYPSGHTANLPTDPISPTITLLPCAFLVGNYTLNGGFSCTDGSQVVVENAKVTFQVTPSGILTYPTNINGTLSFNGESMSADTLQISDPDATVEVGWMIGNYTYRDSLTTVNGTATYKASDLPPSFRQGLDEDGANPTLLMSF